MTPYPALPPPTKHPDTAGKKARLLGVDAARGLALLGMMAVHEFSETTDTGAPSTTQILFVGRSAALFAVLAGVAIAFMTGRRRVTPGPSGRAAAATLATRAGLIGLIGVVGLGWVDMEDAVAVILPAYAAMFLLAIPLVFLSTRVVLAVGAVVALVVPVGSLLVRGGLPEASGDNISLASFADPGGVLAELFLTGVYPALTWMAYLAIGLGVGRLTLSSARVARRLLVVGAGLAVAAPLASWLLLGPLGGTAHLLATSDLDADAITEILTLGPSGVVPADDVWWLATAAPHSGTPLDLAATIGSSLAVLGAMLLLGHLPAAARQVADAVQAPLVAAGSMTLTLYTAHVVYAGAFAEFDSVPEYLAQVVVLVLGAVAWRRASDRGPLEALVGNVANRAAAAARAGATAGPPPDDTATGPIAGLPYRPAVPPLTQPPLTGPPRPVPTLPGPRLPRDPFRPPPGTAPVSVRR
ncbi:heparan-alpha-glucosaminide N-acetyltransferase domain-containing protein [Actinomycetospora aeridis]|uniref:Heparan-alpha-glucosaminide N-acetyltransferase domain-containing protein n=1 Tax=Actinomycetospora aeridis TaxID=3129231 RepID=A0ABU8N9K2_9PSEU